MEIYAVLTPEEIRSKIVCIRCLSDDICLSVHNNFWVGNELADGRFICGLYISDDDLDGLMYVMDIADGNAAMWEFIKTEYAGFYIGQRNEPEKVLGRFPELRGTTEVVVGDTVAHIKKLKTWKGVM